MSSGFAWCMTFSTPEGERVFLENTVHKSLKGCWDRALEEAESTRQYRTEIIGNFDKDKLYLFRSDIVLSYQKWVKYPIGKPRRNRVAWLRRRGWKVILVEISALEIPDRN